MDWSDTAEQAAFRREVQALVDSHLPDLYRRMRDEGVEEGYEGGWVADRASDDAERRGAAEDWTQAVSDKGWFAPHWPAEYGGAGLTPMEQFIYNQELAEAGAPTVGGSGVSLLGPTMIVHGSDEQKQQYLPKILSGETVWAQGYSEPGAGSDLGSLQTRAVRDGDEYVINGQKIWTSFAHHSDAIFALVRTNPDAPKHRGISFLLIDDIHTPGLNLRPLINMAWQHGFNETFFEDVRTPATNVLGEVDRGWYVGMTLLDYERSNISGAVTLRRHIRQLIDFAQGKDADKAQITPSARASIADRYLEAEVGYNFSFRIISMQASGVIPNYEASTAKMFISESRQRLARTGMQTFGLYANLWDGDDERAPAQAAFTQRYITTIPGTIGGGSSEIQRNIIATRGLGLPRG
jgi:alkylation response protein AidB-like acyl-CoA dehydrogenase